MADHPLRSATHRCLGGPLPHQQANGTRTHPSAIACKQRPSFLPKSKWGAYPVLAAVSSSYPGQRGRLSTRYSPVRHSTREPKLPFAFDLHVLSTPPAFNLSQNQTLQFESFAKSLTVTCKEPESQRTFLPARYSLVNEPPPLFSGATRYMRPIPALVKGPCENFFRLPRNSARSAKIGLRTLPVKGIF